MDVDKILDAVYEIQGNADPNDSPRTRKERLDRIYELACEVMDRTGYDPDAGKDGR